MSEERSESEGDRLRDEAVAKVDKNANVVWKLIADYVLKELHERQFKITADDVCFEMEDRFPDVTTHEPRAFGPVFLRAKSAGLIVPTDRYIKSMRPQGHSRPMRVWLSTHWDTAGEY